MKEKCIGKLILISILFILFFLPVLTKANNYLIYPGIGAGSLYIGKTTTQDVVNWLGQPDNTTKGKSGLLYIYTNYGLTLGFNDYNILYSIMITNSCYRTEEDIGVGSSVSDVLRAYPHAKTPDLKASSGNNVIIYNSLIFEYDTSTYKIVRVFVANPNLK